MGREVLKEDWREGIMIGSSSEEEGCEEESQSSSWGGGSRLVGCGESITTVSVRALPLESMVKITSVRGRDWGDSGMEVRLPGRG